MGSAINSPKLSDSLVLPIFLAASGRMRVDRIVFTLRYEVARENP